MAFLLVSALPMTAIAAVVRLALGSPVLFRQRRAGCDGRHFFVVKFRTMTDERDSFGALLPDHLRTTSVTRWFRRTRLDEIPQLLAILTGHMAIVGPRPLLPETIAAMGELGRLRCSVRPGLTGWAQVSGNTRLSDSQKLLLDIWYIHNRTALLDLKILAGTILVLMRGERVRWDRIQAAEAHLLRHFGREAMRLMPCAPAQDAERSRTTLSAAGDDATRSASQAGAAAWSMRAGTELRRFESLTIDTRIDDVN